MADYILLIQMDIPAELEYVRKAAALADEQRRQMPLWMLGSYRGT